MSLSNKELLERERELSLQRKRNLTKIIFKLSGAIRTYTHFEDPSILLQEVGWEAVEWQRGTARFPKQGKNKKMMLQ